MELCAKVQASGERTVTAGDNIVDLCDFSFDKFQITSGLKNGCQERALRNEGMKAGHYFQLTEWPSPMSMSRRHSLSLSSPKMLRGKFPPSGFNIDSMSSEHAQIPVQFDPD